MYAELRTTAGEVLATINARTDDPQKAMGSLARKAGLDYTEPQLVQHFRGGGTYHVQFGKYLPKANSTTLGPTYVVWCEVAPAA